MEQFLDIVLLIIEKSKLKYDIFLLADLITGLCINSKYKFPVYSFSEMLCIKYGTRYHTGYFSTLFYYEKDEAVRCFFEHAKKEQIIIEENKEDSNLNKQLKKIIEEIKRRPGLYISKLDIKHIEAFLEGIFAGEDLSVGVQIGTSMKKFNSEFGRYVSDKYKLYEDTEWYYKLEYISIGFKNNIEVLEKCLIDFLRNNVQ